MVEFLRLIALTYRTLHILLVNPAKSRMSIHLWRPCCTVS